MNQYKLRKDVDELQFLVNRLKLCCASSYTKEEVNDITDDTKDELKDNIDTELEELINTIVNIYSPTNLKYWFPLTSGRTGVFTANSGGLTVCNNQLYSYSKNNSYGIGCITEQFPNRNHWIIELDAWCNLDLVGRIGYIYILADSTMLSPDWHDHSICISSEGVVSSITNDEREIGRLKDFNFNTWSQAGGKEQHIVIMRNNNEITIISENDSLTFEWEIIDLVQRINVGSDRTAPGFGGYNVVLKNINAKYELDPELDEEEYNNNYILSLDNNIKELVTYTKDIVISGSLILRDAAGVDSLVDNEPVVIYDDDLEFNNQLSHGHTDNGDFDIPITLNKPTTNLSIESVKNKLNLKVTWHDYVFTFLNNITTTNSNVLFSVTFTHDNAPVSNQSITLYDGTTLLDTQTTDNKGICWFNLSNINQTKEYNLNWHNKLIKPIKIWFNEQIVKNMVLDPFNPFHETLTSIDGCLRLNGYFLESTISNSIGYIDSFQFSNDNLWEIECVAKLNDNRAGITLFADNGNGVHFFLCLENYRGVGIRIFYDSDDRPVAEQTLRNNPLDKTQNYTFKISKINDNTIKIYINAGISEEYVFSHNSIALAQKLFLGVIREVGMRDITIKYYNPVKNIETIYYQPVLDGTESFTKISGNPVIDSVQHTFGGDIGYLDELIPNTDYWEVQLKAKVNDRGNIGNVAVMLINDGESSATNNSFCVRGNGYSRAYTNGTNYEANSLSDTLNDTDFIPIVIRKISEKGILYKINNGNWAKAIWNALPNIDNFHVGVTYWSNSDLYIKDILVKTSND